MWTSDELGRVRDQLVTQLRELEHARTELEAEVEPPHDSPTGEDVALRVLAVEEELQTEIVDALARLEQNRYGVCEGCGRRIPKERLRALPYARHCMPCASGAKSSG